MQKYGQQSCSLPYEDYLYVWIFMDKIAWLALQNFELKGVLRTMLHPVLGDFLK